MEDIGWYIKRSACDIFLGISCRFYETGKDRIDNTGKNYRRIIEIVFGKAGSGAAYS